MLLLLLLSLPAAANMGAVSAVDVRSGAVYLEQEHPSVALAAEVLWMRMDEAWDATVATWGVAYDVENRSSDAVDQEVVFPVEAWIGHGSQQGGPDQVEEAVADAILDALVPGAAEAFARLSEASGLVLAGGRDRAGEIAGLVRAKEGVLRRAIGPDRLRAGGVFDLQVQLDGTPISVEDAVLEVRLAPPAQGSAETADDPPLAERVYAALWKETGLPVVPVSPEALASVLHPQVWTTVLLRFRLHLPPGHSRLILRYRSPVPYTGTRDFRAWSVSYLLGPGRTWAGPIDRLELRVDRNALRGRVPPAIPFRGEASLDDDALVWTTTRYEPGPADRLVVGGVGFSPFDFVGHPVLEPVIIEPAPIDTAQEEEAEAVASTYLVWSRPQASGLPVGSPTATTSLSGPAWLPFAMDGLLLRDAGFGPENALDGGLATSWCAPVSAARPARLTFHLPRPVADLTLHVGWRAPWFLRDCGNPGKGGRITAGPQAGRCIVLDTGPENTRRPDLVRVLPGEGPTREVEMRGDALTLPGPFPVGDLGIELVSRATEPGIACLAEIGTSTTGDPVLEALEAALAPWMTPPPPAIRAGAP